MTIYRNDGTIITDKYESVEAAVKAGIDLSHANLSGANLSRANLSRANLSYAKLTGANLSYAKLTGAKLTDAYITLGNKMFQLIEVK